MRLENRVALVTGGASGIGRAIAQRFVQEGAAVCVADNNDQGAREVAERLASAGGRAIAFTVDVVDEARVRAMVAATVERLGGLDILVTSAGIGGSAPLLEFKRELWDGILGVNLTGTFLCTKAAASHMVGQRRGRIIHLASVFGQRGVTNRSAYSASKGGVIAFMKTAAVEMAGHGITVNAICPGPIETPLSRRLHTPAMREAFARAVPQGRYGEPGEVADAAVFLASHEAAYITGHELNVDGGYGGLGIMIPGGD